MSWLSPGGRDGASAANPKFASPQGNAPGEFRIQSCTSKLLFLVWLLNLKFLQRACHPWDRNFKFTTLAAHSRSGLLLSPGPIGSDPGPAFFPRLKRSGSDAQHSGPPSRTAVGTAPAGASVK